MHVDAGAVGRRERKNGERAGIASEPKLAGRQLMPRLVLPQIGRDTARKPKPANVVLAVAIVFGYRSQRSPERRHACRVAVGEAGRQTVEEQVDCPRRLRGPGCGAGGLSHVQHAGAAAQAAGENRGCQRFEVRLTREPGVQRFEALRRPEQQRGSVASASQSEGELRAQPLQPSTLQLVERPLFGRGQQRQSLHRAHRRRAWLAPR